MASADRLTPPADSALDSDLSVTLRRAVPLTVQLNDRDVQIELAAETVGEVLAEAHLSLQGLDYSLPADDQPLPADGIIRVVRVREEVKLTQMLLAFTNEYVKSDEVELDKSEVI